MKLRNFLFAACIVALAACSAPAERVINNPGWAVANTRNFDITKIVLTDTATVMYVDARYRPHWWIKWDTTTHLLGNGKKYMITSADGIKLNEHHYMPDSGEDSFVFYFEPVDPKLKTVDLIEGDASNYFKIWGISLREGKGVTNLASEVPRDVRNTDYHNATLPEPEIRNGMSTVKITVLGYNPEYGYDPEIKLFSTIPHIRETFLPSRAENGVYTFEFPLFGPTSARLQLSEMTNVMDILLEPGRENNIWFDPVAYSHKEPRDNTVFAYFDGRYGPFNMAFVNDLMPYDIQRDYFQGWNEPFLRELRDVPADGIIPAMRAKRDANIARVDESDFSPLSKEIMKKQIEGDYIENISQIGFQIMYQYGQDLGLEWGDPIPGYERIVFTPENYKDAYSDVDFNDPYLFYYPWYYRAYNFMNYDDMPRDASGIEGTLIGNYQLTQQVLEMKDHMAPEAHQAAVEKFDAIEDSFFADAIALRTEFLEAQRKAAASKTGFSVSATPEADDIFGAIISKYKGSPVVVDFWATWCGPCLNAMKQHRPHKDELMKEGAIFVYITNETSPEATWESTIPDIKGEHYRVNPDQWKELTRRFDINGIPSYVLVARDGTYAKDDNMRDPSVWRSKIKEALAK